MRNRLPSRLLTWMTFVFAFTLAISFFSFISILKQFDFEINSQEQLLIAGILSVVIFALVSLFAVIPLGKVISYLQRLLDQPKTENIRVDDDAFSDGFKYGEWDELGDLVRRVEGKLRRRTKALLREKTELSAVMNSLLSPIVSVTTKKEVSFFNTAFAVLFDLEHISTNEAIKLKDLIVFNDLTELIYKSMEEENFEKKLLTIRVGERERIFSILMSPLRRGLDNSLYGVVATLNDETQKIELDQKRMDFVANASHELRTPLSAVSASVQLLGKLEDEKTRAEVFESLKSNTKRMVSLAGDLLDLSKLENSEEVLEVEGVLLKDFTNETLKEMGLKKNKRVECIFNTEEAYFDVSKSKQVLTNLISNAIIYTPEEAKIYVSWDEDKVKGGINLTVRDSGEGISEEEQSRIFERFYRVDKSRSRKRGGTGIGLAIVKHIMALHEGSVHLESSQGKGAKFTCHFPQNTKPLF